METLTPEMLAVLEPDTPLAITFTVRSEFFRTVNGEDPPAPPEGEPIIFEPGHITAGDFVAFDLFDYAICGPAIVVLLYQHRETFRLDLAKITAQRIPF